MEFLVGRTVFIEAFPGMPSDISEPWYFRSDGLMWTNSGRRIAWRESGDRDEVCFTLHQVHRCFSKEVRNGTPVIREGRVIRRVANVLEGNQHFRDAQLDRPTDAAFFFGEWVTTDPRSRDFVRITRDSFIFMARHPMGDALLWKEGTVRLPVDRYRMVENGVAPEFRERAARPAAQERHSLYVRHMRQVQLLRDTGGSILVAGILGPSGRPNLARSFRRVDEANCARLGEALANADRVLRDPESIYPGFNTIDRRISVLRVKAGDFGAKEIEDIALDLTGVVGDLIEMTFERGEKTTKAVRIWRRAERGKSILELGVSWYRGVARAVELYDILQEMKEIERRLMPVFNGIAKAAQDYDAIVPRLNEEACLRPGNGNSLGVHLVSLVVPGGTRNFTDPITRALYGGRTEGSVEPAPPIR